MKISNVRLDHWLSQIRRIAADWLPPRLGIYARLIHLDTVAYAALIAAALWTAFLSVGVVLYLSPPAYYADDWWWVSLTNQKGLWAGSLCRLLGHATVLPNLSLLANFSLMGADPLARAVIAAGTNCLAMALVGVLALGGRPRPPLERWAFMAAFAAAGLWQVLNSKLFWSFGMTDALVAIGAVMTAFGLVHAMGAADQERRGLALMLAGSLLATFSFGTAICVWPAFALALYLAGARWLLIGQYGGCGIVAVAAALFVIPSCEGAAANFGDTSASPWAILQTAAMTLGFLPAFAAGKSDANGWATLAYAPLWTAIGLGLIAIVAGAVLRTLVRQDRDPRNAAILGYVMVFIGGVMLVGLSRAKTYGIEVAYSARYAAMILPFWVGIVALALYSLERLRQHYARLGMAVLAGMLVAGSNAGLVGQAVWFHHSVTIGGLAIMIAGKDGRDNPRIKWYWLFSQQVTGALPPLASGHKDIFGSPIGRAYLSSAPRPTAVLSECRGWGRIVPNLTEPGVVGLSGWSSGPDRESIRHLMVYRDGVVVGGGLATLAAVPATMADIDLMPGWRRYLVRRWTNVSRAYGIDSGWIALAWAVADGASVRHDQLEVIGFNRRGPLCRVRLVAN